MKKNEGSEINLMSKRRHSQYEIVYDEKAGGFIVKRAEQSPKESRQRKSTIDDHYNSSMNAISKRYPYDKFYMNSQNEIFPSLGSLNADFRLDVSQRNIINPVLQQEEEKSSGANDKEKRPTATYVSKQLRKNLMKNVFL